MTEYEYREWLLSLVNDWCSEYGDYYELFAYLYSREFIPTIGRDADRASDGLRMRVTYADQEGLALEPDIFGPCRVLEVIAALAIRCENFMWNGVDRTGRWVYGMLENLGVDDMTDGYFDEARAERVVDAFLAHAYAKNGRGGLFTTKDAHTDMRKLEIWYQMCRYLDEVADS